MRLINKLFNKKNDDYYTLSKDNTILNDEPIANDKQNDKQSRRLYNVLTKFMLIIAILILLACAFCYNNSGLAHIMCPIVLGLFLLFIFMANIAIIITSNIKQSRRLYNVFTKFMLKLLF